MTKPMLPGRCPNCGSTNIQAEPLYPYEDEEYDDYGYNQDEPGDLAVFCVSCGHYLGEMDSELFERAKAMRRQLGSWLNQVE